jgi:hypothetical protein
MKKIERSSNMEDRLAFQTVTQCQKFKALYKTWSIIENIIPFWLSHVDLTPIWGVVTLESPDRLRISVFTTGINVCIKCFQEPRPVDSLNLCFISKQVRSFLQPRHLLEVLLGL